MEPTNTLSTSARTAGTGDDDDPGDAPGSGHLVRQSGHDHASERIGDDQQAVPGGAAAEVSADAGIMTLAPLMEPSRTPEHRQHERPAVADLGSRSPPSIAKSHFRRARPSHVSGPAHQVQNCRDEEPAVLISTPTPDRRSE